MTQDELSDRLLDFAVEVDRIVRKLGQDALTRQMAQQLSRSGTSPGPNYEEACACESRKDFVHKLSICLKELKESRFWLRFIIQSGRLPGQELAPTLDECEQLTRIIGKSIITAKRNAR